MQVRITGEYGYEHALLGLGLSYGITSQMLLPNELNESVTCKARLAKRAQALAGRGGGHDKFLRMINVYLDITAPLYWWKQFDTYKVATVAQSESTMHTLISKTLTHDMFEGKSVHPLFLTYLNFLVSKKDFIKLNQNLPQSYLQRRIVSTNYAVLHNIYLQRSLHKLTEWRIFCTAILEQTKHPEFIHKAIIAYPMLGESTCEYKTE